LLEAVAEPPQFVMDVLAQNKRRGTAASNNELPRAQVETLALACCVIEWLNQRPAPSAPGRCAWCGKAESPGAGRRGAPIRDCAADPYMAACRVRAQLASSAADRRDCGTWHHEHSSMRTWR
jgi:hypothetical protein